MVPSSGIIRMQNRRAKLGSGILPDGYGHGDSGAAILRLVYQHGTAVGSGCRTDQGHSQTQAIAAVLDGALTQIPAEECAADILRNSAAAVLNGQAQNASASFQRGTNMAAFGGKLHGIGENIQNSPFQLLPINQGVNILPKAFICQTHVRRLHECTGFFKNLLKDAANFPDFLTILVRPVFCIGHIADDSQCSVQAMIQPSQLFLQLRVFGICLLCHLIGRDQTSGEGTAQLSGSQSQCTKGTVLRTMIHQEDVFLIPSNHGCAPAIGDDVQRQIQTSAGEGFVFFSACQYQIPDIGSNSQQHGCGSLVHPGDDIVLYAKSGISQKIQDPGGIGLYRHVILLAVLSLRSYRENFPGSFRHFSTLYPNSLEIASLF